MYLIIFLIYLAMLVIVNLVSSTVITRILLLLAPVLWILDLILTLYEAKGGIDARMQTGGSVQRGKNNHIHIDISGRRILFGTVCSLWLVAENSFSGELTKRKLRIFVSRKKGGSLDLDLSCEHSGKVKIELTRAGLYDLFGLIPLRCQIRGSAADGKTVANMSVLPELFDCELAYRLHESMLYDTDAYSQLRKGPDPAEVYQIREYADGDPLKSIHWKLSSKHDQLVVRDGSFPIDKNILVVMDKSVVTGTGEPGTMVPGTTDACIDMTVSVSRALLELGLSHQLAYNNIEENYCYVTNISSEDDLFGLLPGIMTGGFRETSLSCAAIYAGLETGTMPSHVIYISVNDVTDAPDYFPASKVTELKAVKDVYRELYAQIDL